MSRFDGKTALITGAAIGQGRAHAVRLSSEGANVILFDICAPVAAASHVAATVADLEETARLARANGHGVITRVGDIRDIAALREAVAAGEKEFGTVDIGVANAGVTPSPFTGVDVTEELFREVVDVNTFGAWNTVRAVAEALLVQGKPGAITVTGSGAAYKGYAGLMPYVVSKHAIVGLVKSMAKELGPARIRVNAVHPGTVNTGMFGGVGMVDLYLPDLPQDERTIENMRLRTAKGSPMGLSFVEPEDLAAMVAFLVSDDAQHITGGEFKVDGGMGIA
ncbi:MAG: 3-ketoacyl-ACP reductase [Microbacteriaceae bacterium]|jgi:NAD(P)-dependent dehydrogenase (short-subunit alcohol dehydrogenase family)|nr:3-ketoacyl-ACP reductase [Microbacteriaceae bacterium]